MRGGAWQRIAFATILALSIRAAYVFVRYELGAANVQRFHVESAALILVASGLTFRLSRGIAPAQRLHSGRPSFVICAIFGLGALALYWPARGVGFLSDDFILVQYASAWTPGPTTPEFFRPVPLFLWGFFLHLGASATTIHLVNILLHGTNAYLTVRLVSGWIEGREWSLLAGGLVLASPLAPEPVVWCSGIFDVFATTLLLTLVLVARGYEHDAHLSRRTFFFAVGCTAFLTKETAAVAPLLVAIDAWVRRSMPAKLRQDAIVFGGLTALMSAGRLVARFGLAETPFRRFVIQRALFTSFGSLAVPWHVDALIQSRLFPLVTGLLAIGLVTAFSLRRDTSRTTHAVLGGAAWILVAIAPVFSILSIESDLQGSRYMYLPGVGWAAVIGALAADVSGRRVWRTAMRVSIASLVVLNLYGTRIHLRHWQDAATLRSRVELAAQSNIEMKDCAEVTLSNLPDSVRGAYLFRNGAREAFARDIGMQVTATDETRHCAFQWNEGSFVKKAQ